MHATSLEKFPPQLFNKIVEYVPRYGLCSTIVSRMSQRLFGDSFHEFLQPLLHAIYLGDEATVAGYLRLNPHLLFATTTYTPLLLNTDDNLSVTSEQIYYDVSPWQLSLYTGDWSMWRAILPLIPQNMIQTALDIMRQTQRSGPDLVKVAHDPRLQEWTKLSQLLSNPDGIICYKQEVRHQYFYVNKEQHTIEPLELNFTNISDEEDFRIFQTTTIDHEIATDSSLRTNDAQH